MFDVLEKVLKAKETTTVGTLRPLIEHYEDVRFSRVLVNKQRKESFHSWCNKTEAPKRLGFVQTLDAKPQRRMMKLLRDQGMQENQQITFLSDGTDNVRDLQFLMHPESEHILD